MNKEKKIKSIASDYLDMWQEYFLPSNGIISIFQFYFYHSIEKKILEKKNNS